MEKIMPRQMGNTMQRLPTRAQSIIAEEQAAYIRDVEEILAGFAVGFVLFIAILNYL
jgi:hypothetical protein